MDNMDDFKTSGSDLTDRSELQAGLVLINVGVVADLQLLNCMSKDTVSFSLADVEGLPISGVDKPIDVVLESFDSLLRKLIHKLLGVVGIYVAFISMLWDEFSSLGLHFLAPAENQSLEGWHSWLCRYLIFKADPLYREGVSSVQLLIND